MKLRRIFFLWNLSQLDEPMRSWGSKVEVSSSLSPGWKKWRSSDNKENLTQSQKPRRTFSSFCHWILLQVPAGRCDDLLVPGSLAGCPTFSPVGVNSVCLTKPQCSDGLQQINIRINTVAWRPPAGCCRLMTHVKDDLAGFLQEMERTLAAAEVTPPAEPELQAALPILCDFCSFNSHTVKSLMFHVGEGVL